MAENNVQIVEPTVKTGIVVGLRRFYRDYRILRKSGRKKPKERQRFQKRLEFHSQFVKEGDLCFDIGANIGNRVEVFTKLGATVVAVEPQKSCCRVLIKNFGKNSNVNIVNKALDKTVSEKEFFIDRSHTLSSMSKEWIAAVRHSGRFSNHTWDDKVKVETTTLDLLIKEYGKPDFCKIDVEGFEFEVIQGLTQPVNRLSFEFVSEFIDPVLNCVRYLSKLGPAEFNYSLAESMSFALPSWVDADDMTDALQALPNQLAVQGDIYVRFSSEKRTADPVHMADSFLVRGTS